MKSKQGELTYQGTSGHSGTATSKDRAVREDTSGKTGERQRVVLKALGIAGARGMTVKELRNYMRDAHHGQVSSALTNLHRAGRIERLVEKRDKCKVYVLPGFVNGRTVEVPVGNKSNANLRAVVEQVKDMHTPGKSAYRDPAGLFCPECGQGWPCRTYKFVTTAVNK